MSFYSCLRLRDGQCYAVKIVPLVFVVWVLSRDNFFVLSVRCGGPWGDTATSGQRCGMKTLLLCQCTVWGWGFYRRFSTIFSLTISTGVRKTGVKLSCIGCCWLRPYSLLWVRRCPSHVVLAERGSLLQVSMGRRKRGCSPRRELKICQRKGNRTGLQTLFLKDQGIFLSTLSPF